MAKNASAPSRKSNPPSSRIQRWSTPALLKLHRAPRATMPLITAALLVAGLMVPNGALAALFLGLLLLMLLWLIALSWPVLTAPARFMRLGVIVALGLVTVQRALGRM